MTKMLKLGIIGTGRMAVRLADLALKSGHSVVLGSRDPARAVRIAGRLAGPVSGGSYEDALDQDIILPSVFIRDGFASYFYVTSKLNST